MRGPNMEYCAFENTTLAMEQLISMLQSAGEESMTDYVNSMSRHEVRAFREMYETCQRLMEAVVAANDQLDTEARAEFIAETYQEEEDFG